MQIEHAGRSPIQGRAQDSGHDPATILYVQYPSDLYGTGRSLLRLTSIMDRTRYSPVVVLKGDGPLRGHLEAAGVPVKIIPSMCVIERKKLSLRGLASLAWEFAASTRTLMRLLRSSRVKIVHTNTGIIPSPALAAWLAGVPHVWHIRDWFGEFRGMWHVFSRYILLFSARIICVSKPIAAQFPGNPKVLVRNDCFDLGEFQVDRQSLRTAFRNQWRIGKDDLVIGTVGRIKFVRKGQETLVQALWELRNAGIRVRGLIVGSAFPGNEDHLLRLKALIRELDMTEDILLVGELADPKPAYAAMDVFVLPSAQPEPFGGVVMEAMAMELPVVGTAIGGTLEQIVEGETGFLYPPSDSSALASCLKLLCGDRVMREKMGIAGRERIKTHFDLVRFVRGMEDLYDEVLLQEKSS